MELPPGKLLRLDDYRRPSSRVFFDRRDFDKLLAIYAERVAAGEWRDYAIDEQADRADFTVFRRSHECPLYVISKLAPAAERPGRYLVSSGAKKLIQGRSIEEVLWVFERSPEPA
ncbi:MAG: DUF2794 domain-containing protein [Pseudomonadota bacterium]